MGRKSEPGRYLAPAGDGALRRKHEHHPRALGVIDENAFLGLPWVLWGCLALIVAGVYSVVWPRPRADGPAPSRPTPRRFVLRWFHALVWALLALSCFVRAALPEGGSAAANAVALLALPAYAVFLGALAMDRRSGR